MPEKKSTPKKSTTPKVKETKVAELNKEALAELSNGKGDDE